MRGRHLAEAPVHTKPPPSWILPRHRHEHQMNLSWFLSFLGKYYNAIHKMDRRTAPTGFPQQMETQTDSLTDFIDQLNAEATAAVAPPTVFPSRGDFNDSSTGALKWKDLLVDTIYQIRSARSVHTQHGTTFILSLQTADGFCYNGWACGSSYVCLSDRLD